MAQKFTSPFFSKDMTAALAEYATPNLDAEAVIQTQRKNVEAANVIGQKMLEVSQSMMRRQVQASKEMMEDAGKLVRDLMGDGTPEEKAVRQTELLRKSFEKAVKNFKDMSDAAQKARSEMEDVVTGRMTACLVELKSSLQTGTGHKKSPAAAKTSAGNDSSMPKAKPKSSAKTAQIKSPLISKANTGLVKKAAAKPSKPKAKAVMSKAPMTSKPMMSIVGK